MLQLDKTTHTYTKDGSPVLNVTRILELEGCYKGSDFFTDGKRTIGDYVHQATAMLDKYELEESSLDDALTGYVESWKKFVAVTGFVSELIEVPLYSTIYGFAGTVDRIGRFNASPQRVLLDIKCGVAEQPVDAVQTGGYELLAQENSMVIEIRGCCYLQPDGKLPQWRPHKEFTDRDIFLSMLSVVRWKQKRGLL